MKSQLAITAACLAFTAHAPAQILSLSGPCPGLMNFQVTGATPNGNVAFIHAASTGSFTIPGGLVCFGTTLGLAPPVTLAGVITANAGGIASVNFTVPAAVCGNRFLQAVDMTSCTTTNVVLIN